MGAKDRIFSVALGTGAVSLQLSHPTIVREPLADLALIFSVSELLQFGANARHHIAFA